MESIKVNEIDVNIDEEEWTHSGIGAGIWGKVFTKQVKLSHPVNESVIKQWATSKGYLSLKHWGDDPLVNQDVDVNIRPVSGDGKNYYPLPKESYLWKIEYKYNCHPNR